MGILAQDDVLPGFHLLNHTNYHFEVLKLDPGDPAPAGEPGRIVVTDLYNYATPLITTTRRH